MTVLTAVSIVTIVRVVAVVALVFLGFRLQGSSLKRLHMCQPVFAGFGGMCWLYMSVYMSAVCVVGSPGYVPVVCVVVCATHLC